MNTSQRWVIYTSLQDFSEDFVRHIAIIYDQCFNDEWILLQNFLGVMIMFILSFKLFVSLKQNVFDTGCVLHCDLHTLEIDLILSEVLEK